MDALKEEVQHNACKIFWNAIQEGSPLLVSATGRKKAVCKFLQEHSKDFPNFAKLVLVATLASGSNATPERVFSKVAWTTSGRRSSVKVPLLRNILRMTEQAPKPKGSFVMRNFHYYTASTQLSITSLLPVVLFRTSF